MLIIVEGTDLCGKTTLASKLSSVIGLNTQYLHAGKPAAHPITEYEYPLRDYVPGTGQNIILDRWHLGEGVWPTFYGRPTDYDTAVRNHVELFLASRGAVLVLAEAQPDVLKERIRAEAVAGRREDIQEKDVNWLLGTFWTQAIAGYLPVYPFDFTITGVDEFVDVVMRVANREELIAARPFLYTRNWLGDPIPDTLFVGEQPGNGPGNQPLSADVPLPPFKAASGHALFDSLPTELTPAFVNALRADGMPEPLRMLWDIMKQPNVVALGNVADEALEMQDVPHGVAPHPQYVRRFFSKAVPERYCEALGRAATGEDVRSEFKQ